MSRLKLITFDLDNTLWPVDEVIRRAERQCRDWISERYPDAAAAMTVARVRDIREQLLREKPGYLHNLTALRRDALAAGFRSAGYCAEEAGRLAAEAFEVFHEARNEVVFFPGALDILETLADSYMLGALTNGNADLARIGIADLFAFQHSSESVGRRKPERDMFDAALRSARVRAIEAVHVGDHPLEDVDAARRHGFHAVWANLLDQKWPLDLPDHPHHIHNLHELSDLVALLDA
ncbi:MAG: HAD family hydrolase [Alcanivorax sp.]|nr:HAD family hydrolase [Alcanivorax sp.]